MYNLYSQVKAREEIVRLSRIADNGEREMVNLSWGFVLLQQGKAPRRVVNFRDDKARTSSFWRESFERRRCLVPATSFSEPKGERPATWHWFALNGAVPRPLFSFAGIWRRYKGPLKKNGDAVELDVFSILTTTPNALVSTPKAIHFNPHTAGTPVGPRSPKHEKAARWRP